MRNQTSPGHLDDLGAKVGYRHHRRTGTLDEIQDVILSEEEEEECVCIGAERERHRESYRVITRIRARTRARLYFHAARLALGEARYNDNSAERHFRHDISHHRDPSR